MNLKLIFAGLFIVLTDVALAGPTCWIMVEGDVESHAVYDPSGEDFHGMGPAIVGTTQYVPILFSGKVEGTTVAMAEKEILRRCRKSGKVSPQTCFENLHCSQKRYHKN